jgi:DNA-binding beta-propeller fold protein YncE
VTDFLAELRHEVTDAHAARAQRGRRRRVARSPWRREAVLGAAAVAASVLAVVVAVRWLGPLEPVGPRVVHTVPIGGIPFGGVVHDGSVWIADHAGARVLRVDPRERRVRARIPLGGQPVAIAAERGGELWVRTGRPGSDDTTVSRIDPARNRVTGTTAVGPDFPLAVAGGAAWAAVWATDDNVPPEGLYRIGATGEAPRRIALQSIGALAAAGEDVWALTTPGELVRIDAATGRVARRWPRLVPASGATAGGHALIADAGGAWVLSTPRSGGGSLVRVQDDRVVQRIAVLPAAQPMLAETAGGLWVARADEALGRNALSRIDRDTGEVTATVDLGGHRPVALLAAGHAVWVVGGDGTLLVVQ